MTLKLRLLCFALRSGRRLVRKKKLWIGRQFYVRWENAPDVEVFLYKPQENTGKPLPALFNVHGGAWVGGDATSLDTQSQMLANLCSAFVVNINYRKLDEIPFPELQLEVRDTVLYFMAHAAEYGLDKSRFHLVGYSAGGHLCAGAAMLLRDAGVSLCSQVLCYPFLDSRIFAGSEAAAGLDVKTLSLMKELVLRGGTDVNDPVMSPAAAPSDALQGLPPAEILLCGTDELYAHGAAYHEQLKAAGIDSELKVFDNAIHGFMEVNFPETREHPAKSVEQEALMHEAFAYLSQRVRARWGEH